MIDPNIRYVQIAFNQGLNQVYRMLPQIPHDRRIIIEAGTPFIKENGVSGIRAIRSHWRGEIVADLKISDGAWEEVLFAARSGATAVTCLGSAPVETLNSFVKACEVNRIFSMIDMLGVKNPLKRLMPMKKKPNAVIIHKGRDEESNALKMIRFKDITKIRGKYDCLISVAGGIIPERIRTAYFNGADIAILNIVEPNSHLSGIRANADLRKLIPIILNEIGQ